MSDCSWLKKLPVCLTDKLYLIHRNDHLFDTGDCAVNGDYHDLPDELNQSRDNGGQDDDGDQDDQQVDSYIKVYISSANSLG